MTILLSLVLMTGCKPAPEQEKKEEVKITAEAKLAGNTYEAITGDSITFDDEGIPIGAPTPTGKFSIMEKTEFKVTYVFKNGDKVLGTSTVTIDKANSRHITVNSNHEGTGVKLECYLHAELGPSWLMGVSIDDGDGSLTFEAKGFIPAKPGMRQVIAELSENYVKFLVGKDGNQETIEIRKLPGPGYLFQIKLSFAGSEDILENTWALTAPGFMALRDTKWKNGSATIEFNDKGVCEKYLHTDIGSMKAGYIYHMTEHSIEFRIAAKVTETENYHSMSCTLRSDGKLTVTERTVKNGKIVETESRTRIFERL